MYRRNIFGILGAALAATYPVAKRIVGEQFFLCAVRAFIRQYPSQSGDLNEYCQEFADFLARFPPAASLAYLPDVARLEWLAQAIHCVADRQVRHDILSVLAAAPDLAANTGAL